jgi:macrolide transport system ATP-binding/permease protein
MFMRKRDPIDFSAEIKAHLQLETDRLKEQGLTEIEAQGAARRAFGNVARAEERFFESGRWSQIESFWQDLKYAIRTLRKSPGFTWIAVGILGLAMAANIAVFSVFNGMLLRPIPAADPDQLVRFSSTGAGIPPRRAFSYPYFQDLQDKNDAFSDVIAWTQATVLLKADEQSDQLLAETVSGNYFSALSLHSANGRLLASSDDNLAVDRVAVISDAFWRRRFGSDRSVIGKQFFFNGTNCTVVGIAPAGYTGVGAGLAVDVWFPLKQGASWVAPNLLTDRIAPSVQVMGRLRPGISIEQAQAAMTARAQLLERAFPDANRGKGISLRRARYLDNRLRGPLTGFLSVILALVGFVLLGACINLANLFIVRIVGRRRELALRRSLGASRIRLARQILTESMIIALGGGVAGVLLGSWSASLLSRFNPLPPTIPLHFDLRPDYRVYVFALIAAFLTGILLGAISSSQAWNSNVFASLKEGSGNVGGRSSKLRAIFVTLQIAVSMVLLIGAGLFLRSLQKVGIISIGFDPNNAVAMDIDLTAKLFSETRGYQFYREMIRRVDGLPGVQSASLVDLAPLDSATPFTDVLIPGLESLRGKTGIRVSLNNVAPSYFQTMKIPLQSGREFNELDDSKRPGVVIINQTMAREYWPGQDPLGKSFALVEGRGAPKTIQIVGVANDVRYRSLGEDPTPHIYLCFLQHYAPDMTLVVRVNADSGAMLTSIQRELQSQDRDVQGFFSRTLIQHIGLALLPARVAAGMSAAFGGFALVLAVIGIYGVVSYTAGQRTREIGLRMALGAQPSDILRLILSQAGRPAVLGIAAGLVAAFILTRFVAGLLYGISAEDPITFMGVTFLLAAIAMMSSYLPARRAMHVDPIVALRHD